MDDIILILHRLFQKPALRDLRNAFNEAGLLWNHSQTEVPQEEEGADRCLARTWKPWPPTRCSLHPATPNEGGHPGQTAFPRAGRAARSPSGVSSACAMCPCGCPAGLRDSVLFSVSLLFQFWGFLSSQTQAQRFFICVQSPPGSILGSLHFWYSSFGLWHLFLIHS